MNEEIRLESKYGTPIIDEDTPSYFVKDFMLFSIIREGEIVAGHIPSDWSLVAICDVNLWNGKSLKVYKVMDLSPIGRAI